MIHLLSLLSSFLGANLVLLYDWLTDFRLIEFKKKSPNHAKGLVYRAIGLLVASIPIYFIGDIYIIGLYLFDVCVYYWIMFDPGLNLLRDRDFFYKGISSDPEEDAWFDEQFEKTDPKKLLKSKIALFIILTFLLILIWN
jgi:hypothetical protein